MKVLLIISGLSVGILMGIFPSIEKPRPMHWKLSAVGLMAVLIIFGLLPPTAASINETRFITLQTGKFEGDVLFRTNPGSERFEESGSFWVVEVLDGINPKTAEKLIINAKNLPDEFKKPGKLILNVSCDTSGAKFIYNSTKYVDPLFTFPYIIQLQERIRIMNFHVPVAWVAVLAYLISMIYAVQYLRTKNMEFDMRASVAASLGTLFCVLATATGMIWAKFNWGAFWNWDPRQTSIFVLLLIYGAYFALRSAINGDELKARLSSVYSIIAFITVPFFIFVLPRITSGLHPGSGGEETSGPVLSTETNMLNPAMQIAFALGLASFTVLFFWMFSIMIRYRTIKKYINENV